MSARIVLVGLLTAAISACGEESYCERVDCEETSTSSTTTTSTPTSSGASNPDASSTADGSGGGSGGSDEGGGNPTSTGGSGPGTGGSDPFEVTPADGTKVGILRSLSFEATTDVEWSVAEDDGGTIDADGQYLSPEEPGTFHVVATAESGVDVVVEVVVAPLGLEVAGGRPGGAGNLDGNGARARFRSPRGLGVLDDGRYVIADTGNHTLRLYDDEEGEVVTLAGSPGIPGTSNGVGDDARFDTPTDVVVDGDDVFVVDGEGTCIRHVDVDTASVSTFAGACGVPGSVEGATGALSRFDHIDAMVRAPDDSGLYVCHQGTWDILRVSSGTGATVHSFVEGFTAGNDCKLTPNPPDEIIYVHASGSTIVSSISMNLSGGATTIASIPGTDEDLGRIVYEPGDETLYAFDRERPDGPGTPRETRLYAADLSDASPSFDELTGGELDYVDGPLAAARFLTPSFLVPEPNGDLLFSEEEGHTIRRISFSGVDEVETVLGAPANVYPKNGSATTGRLAYPYSVALGEGDADIYVAGAFVSRVIRRIDAATGAIETFSGVPDDYILGTETSFDDPVDGQADEATFGLIIDIERIGDALYVIDSSFAVRRVSLETGAVDTVAGTIGEDGYVDTFGAAARFDFFGADFGGGLATDGTDLFIADTGNFAIRKLDVSSGEVTTLAGGTEGTADGEGENAQFRGPSGLAYDDGFLYIADAGAHTIRRLDLATNEVTTLTGQANTPGTVDGSPSQARFARPFRIAADGIGNLYVTSLGVNDGDPPHTIRRIRLADARTLPFAGDDVQYGFADGALPASLGCPIGLVVDGAGDLVFTDACDGALGAIRAL